MAPSASAVLPTTRRRPGVIAVNFRLPLDAAELLTQFAASSKGKGHFVARLLYEHQVRLEERQRVQEGVTGNTA